MTYCIGMRLDKGLVFLSDSRTNAGVDHIGTFRKMTVFERPGERVLVLLTAGAGGQTGWANPFAFVRAVRAFWPGLVVMAGGMADGHAIAAAEMLGCDLAYMGTRFIATRESLAKDGYKDMLVRSRLDDVLLKIGRAHV